jgi:hypothetical protein
VLRELIRRTIFATDAESSRYALGGVLFEMHSDKIIAVGTDGRRLARMEGPAESCNGHETGETTTIIPTRSLQVIDRALSDLDAEVLIAVRSNDVLVKTPQATIYTRLVEGRFPKWRDVFPVRHKAIQVEMNVGPLYSAVRQAAIVADEETRGPGFRLWRRPIGDVRLDGRRGPGARRIADPLRRRAGHGDVGQPLCRRFSEGPGSRADVHVGDRERRGGGLVLDRRRLRLRGHALARER